MLINLLFPVLLGIALAELGLFVSRSLVSPEALRASNDVIGNYLQTLGSLYAVLLAFVVFVVWTQFNDARGYVEREANELVDICRTSLALPSLRTAIHDLLGQYIEALTLREWDLMSKCNGSELNETRGILDKIWNLISTFEPQTDGQSAVMSEMLSRLNDLSDVRALRLTASQLKIPMALRIFLYMGAAMTIGSMYLFSVESWLIHAFIVGAMAGVLSHILYLIADLDNCFAGDWQVPKVAFHRVSGMLQMHQSAATNARFKPTE
jgi:hypothetical protein